MYRNDALTVAAMLAKCRPDRGNKYEPRGRLAKKRAAFDQWQETCRTFAYAICVTAKIVPERDFYAACGYDVEEAKALAWRDFTSGQEEGR